MTSEGAFFARHASVRLYLLAACVLYVSVFASAGTNLVLNGSFDDPGDPLKGWTHDYRYTGNSWYMKNHEHVSVIEQDGSRTNVLRLTGTRAIFWGTGQGVKVDSKPIPFDHTAKYRLSAWARTTKGPNCRIYLEGYQWLPGIRPHPDPELAELRKVYRQGAGRIMYFGDKRDGPFCNALEIWSQASSILPPKELSSAARAHLEKVRFLVVHIVAIDGHDGDLLVDDVVLETYED